MSKDLKEKNAAVRAMIENEKKSLSDKVGDQLESTLQLAVKERI